MEIGKKSVYRHWKSAGNQDRATKLDIVLSELFLSEAERPTVDVTWSQNVIVINSRPRRIRSVDVGLHV